MLNKIILYMNKLRYFLVIMLHLLLLKNKINVVFALLDICENSVFKYFLIIIIY